MRSGQGSVTRSGLSFHGARCDQLRFLLRYAQLAPSLYNTQPWLFRIDGDMIEILAHRRRTLAHADSQERQLMMSTGAVVAALCIAGGHFDFDVRARPLPRRALDEMLLPDRIISFTMH